MTEIDALQHDSVIDNSPTEDAPADVSFTPAQIAAANTLKNFFRQLVALRRVRILYAKSIEVLIDETTKKPYYKNPKTGILSWSLPSFMDGTLDHEFDDSSSISKSADGSSEESSEAESEDSEMRRKKKIISRKWPR
jgi:hypothetical protein